MLKRSLPFQEQREEVLSQLADREQELKHEWLSASSGFHSISNEHKRTSWAPSQSQYLGWWLLNAFKTTSLFVITAGLSLIVYLILRSKRESISVLGELRDLKKREEEIETAKAHFGSISDSEESYKLSRQKELEPWTEKLIRTSLTTMPFKAYEEMKEKKRDPYLQFLHVYACIIAIFFTAGLILFYFLYRKHKDSRYKFLESALSKHVIERIKFEEELGELVRKKYGENTIEQLTYSFDRPFKDLSLSSSMLTGIFKRPVSRVSFIILISLLSLGIYPIFAYGLACKQNKKKFYEWWIKRKDAPSSVVEPLGNVPRKWWGRAIKYARSLWTDLYFSTYLSGSISNVITTTFFKPKRSLRTVNWTLFWMFTSPISKWVLNVFLLVATYTLVLLLGVHHAWNISNWSFYAAVAVGALFLLLLGYHVFLII
nr:hypothetical protein [Candidatus Mycoplasma haematolamae]